MRKFDLDQALSRVTETRNRPKKSSITKVWYQLFDELYLERLNKNGSNEIINIILENKHLIK